MGFIYIVSFNVSMYQRKRLVVWLWNKCIEMNPWGLWVMCIRVAYKYQLQLQIYVVLHIEYEFKCAMYWLSTKVRICDSGCMILTPLR